MKLLDHARVVFVLQGEHERADDLCAQLRARNAWPVVVDLRDESRWPGLMRESLLGLGGPRGRLDALVLAPQPFCDDAFWRTQDGLVEALERVPSPVAVVSHADGCRLAEDDDERCLILTDGVPSDPTAVLFDSTLLDRLVEIMPVRATHGPLAPQEWLTIALWISRAVSGTTRCALAWPAFQQSAAHAFAA